MSAGMSLDIWHQATVIAVCCKQGVGMFLKYLSLPDAQSRPRKPKKEQHMADNAMPAGMFLECLT
jgi:hypothetical protein